MAQYVDRSLGAREVVARRGRWPDIAWVLFWALAAIISNAMIAGVAYLGWSLAWMAALWGVLAVFFVRWALHMITTEFAVTNQRVILKRGLITRYTRELTIDSVESVALHQSVLGRLFNFGSLTITGTGDALIKFPPMAQPVAFRRAIESNRQD